jgi:hypothetical protein
MRERTRSPAPQPAAVFSVARLRKPHPESSERERLAGSSEAESLRQGLGHVPGYHPCRAEAPGGLRPR